MYSKFTKSLKKKETNKESSYLYLVIREFKRNKLISESRFFQKENEAFKLYKAKSYYCECYYHEYFVDFPTLYASRVT